MVVLRPHLVVASVAFVLDIASGLSSQCNGAKYQSKPRVYVSTDIGNEPDDQMSFVRFLTYSNEFRVEGIAATTSVWLNDTTNLPTLETILNSYENITSNLNANVPDEGQYPSADSLRQVLAVSKPVYGLAAQGGNLSSAAELLINAVDSSEESLWFLAWSGPLVLAEALYYIREVRTTSAVEDFVRKLRVYAISDQDDSGPWIRVNFPSLFYIVSIGMFPYYETATWPGISGDLFYKFDNGGPDTSLVTNDWLQVNIRKGFLGQHYPNFTYIMEGDTPSFLHLIQNGLGEPDHPEWGGWGGRYGNVDSSGLTTTFSDVADVVTGVNGANFTSNKATIWRWRQAYQYDFAARINWSTTADTTQVNHPPVVVLNDTCGPESLQLQVDVGETVTLDASQSWDPDGDTLSYSWDLYWDTSKVLHDIVQHGSDIALWSTTPLNAEGSIIEIVPLWNTSYHVILTVSDNQEKELVAYRRVILYT